jgi:hypothetical protein
MSEKAGFTINILGETNPYKIYSVFVLPDSQFNITSETDILISSQTVEISQTDSKSWKVITPGVSGEIYTLKITNALNNEMRLNILILTPISEKKGEYLNGYRIGNYPISSPQSNPIYNRPKGFFEVTEDNQDILLTPHFTIRQFICKQNSGFPKYLIIRERLLLKLEYLLELVNGSGYTINTFGFISGFRTPYYNKVIKNVSKSRHLYGGAADIFIDQNNDGSMDDLNKDGITDEKDVKIFYNIVETEFGKPGYDKFKGGLGFYRKNGLHNGFIHVDVRGWKARW